MRRLRVISPAAMVGRVVVYGALLGLLGYVCIILAEGAGMRDRILYLRYWSLFAIGVFAAAPPHVLLPDPKRLWFQFLNPSPGRLFLRELGRWMPTVLLLILPSLLLAYDIEDGRWLLSPADGHGEALEDEKAGPQSLIGHLLAAVFVMLGSAVFSFWRYMRIGQVSQDWQEGKRGGWYRALTQNSTTGSLGMPHGLVPVFGVTSYVFLAGTAVVLLSAYVAVWQGTYVAWAPGFVLTAMAVMGLAWHGHAFDRYFYRTNALYVEVFRSAGGLRVAEREPIPFRAVYWVPAQWKAHVWAGLRQLDRRLPLGRFIFFGHVLLWLLFWQGARATVIAAYLLVFSVIKNGAIVLHATTSMAPGALHAILQPPASWTLTRFYMNLRWTLPFLLSLAFVAVLTDRFSYLNAVSWMLLDVLLAFLTAWTVTTFSEARYRKRYA